MMNLRRFFVEKDVPHTQWVFQTPTGASLISSDYVIDLILTTGRSEQERIAAMLQSIDATNGDVLHYLHFLAEQYVTSGNGVRPPVQQPQVSR